mmetsp:Transcript_33641/g.56563  ORF Transcript_33641/g.56563 Transcript_33641/m.56563 type:complete len:192 (-) Transcript_33641:389-964(-)|eukprot:CAMPEP_0184658396 /NCGR_PEP_ID=MMETSP0308-20130426/25236_1 /TAXON_ID=38269 /ORGANISM="Gloeochaete witrockiana, Strain SAG 46.84" /LENGTH=191 /DNA_ID=CAMNT_0027097349 /DNA_START=175 /DNA_END=750 /DNA_ORIENTATION=-
MSVSAFIVATPSVISISTAVSSISSSSLKPQIPSGCLSSTSKKVLRSSFVPSTSSFTASRSFVASPQKTSVPEILSFNEEWYDRGILDSSRFPNKLETDSFYGFGKNAERFNGRAAMLGFTLGIATEVLTGKGIFAQIGIVSHDDQLRMMTVLGCTWLATSLFQSLYASNKDRVDRLLKVGKYADAAEELD